MLCGVNTRYDLKAGGDSMGWIQEEAKTISAGISVRLAFPSIVSECIIPC